ncbi:MAG: cupin domain-containing protein [Methylophilaceae bacterium]|nr:cupin domain-containing protein [Methylophilaceae bacterium]
MANISIEHNPSEDRLKQLGVAKWPTWSKEVSVFPFEFNARETAYILEGDCTITPNDGSAAVDFTAGDLLVFPEGLSCKWEVKKALKKHYKHG